MKKREEATASRDCTWTEISHPGSHADRQTGKFFGLRKMIVDLFRYTEAKS